MDDAIIAYQCALADVHGQKTEHTAGDFLRFMTANEHLFADGIRRQALMPSQLLLSYFAQVTEQFLHQLRNGSELPIELRDRYESGTVVFPMALGQQFLFVVPSAERSNASRLVNRVQETIWTQAAHFGELEKRLRAQVKLTVLPNANPYMDGERTYRNYGHIIIPADGRYHLFTIDAPQPKYLPLSTLLIPGPQGVLVGRIMAQMVPTNAAEERVSFTPRDRLLAITVDDAIAETRQHYHSPESTGSLVVARGTQGIPLIESAVSVAERLYSTRLGMDDRAPRQQKR